VPLAPVAADAALGGRVVVIRERHPWSGGNHTIRAVDLPAMAKECLTPPPIRWNTVAYLLMGEDDISGLEGDFWAAGSDVYLLRYKKRERDALYFPNSTVGEGFNAVYFTACKQEQIQEWSYAYYVHITTDAHMQPFSPPVASFRQRLEDFLWVFRPAVATPMYETVAGGFFRHLRSFVDPGTGRVGMWTDGPFSFMHMDYTIVAVRHDAARTLLPQETQHDERCWWLSQWIFTLQAALHFGGSTLLMPDVGWFNLHHGGYKNGTLADCDWAFDRASERLRGTLPEMARACVPNHLDQYIVWGWPGAEMDAELAPCTYTDRVRLYASYIQYGSSAYWTNVTKSLNTSLVRAVASGHLNSTAADALWVVRVYECLASVDREAIAINNRTIGDVAGEVLRQASDSGLLARWHIREALELDCILELLHEQEPCAARHLAAAVQLFVAAGQEQEAEQVRREALRLRVHGSRQFYWPSLAAVSPTEWAEHHFSADLEPSPGPAFPPSTAVVAPGTVGVCLYGPALVSQTAMESFAIYVLGGLKAQGLDVTVVAALQQVSDCGQPGHPGVAHGECSRAAAEEVVRVTARASLVRWDNSTVGVAPVGRGPLVPWRVAAARAAVRALGLCQELLRQAEGSSLFEAVLAARVDYRYFAPLPDLVLVLGHPAVWVADEAGPEAAAEGAPDAVAVMPRLYSDLFLSRHAALRDEIRLAVALQRWGTAEFSWSGVTRRALVGLPLVRFSSPVAQAAPAGASAVLCADSPMQDAVCHQDIPLFTHPHSALAAMWSKELFTTGWRYAAPFGGWSLLVAGAGVAPAPKVWAAGACVLRGTELGCPGDAGDFVWREMGREPWAQQAVAYTSQYRHPAGRIVVASFCSCTLSGAAECDEAIAASVVAGDLAPWVLLGVCCVHPWYFSDSVWYVSPPATVTALRRVCPVSY